MPPGTIFRDIETREPLRAISTQDWHEVCAARQEVENDLREKGLQPGVITSRSDKVDEDLIAGINSDSVIPEARRPASRSHRKRVARMMKHMVILGAA